MALHIADSKHKGLG